MAFSRSAGRFRVCHLSIQGNHLHLIVEADDKQTLSRGMQGFLISCAKQLNRVLGRRGRVFADRYHAVILTTPRHVRNVLCYVMQNWRHHGERTGSSTLGVDPFSTSYTFDGWAEKLPPAIPWPEGGVLGVWWPQTWLLATGWRRHGLIGVREVPGRHAS